MWVRPGEDKKASLWLAFVFPYIHSVGMSLSLLK